MQLMSLNQQSKNIITGRMSDGSDRVITAQSWWQAVVLDDNKIQHIVDFPIGGSQPTNQQIITAINALQPSTLIPTSKADLAIYMKSLRDDWIGWRQVRIEAQVRPASASAVQPLIVQENTAWNLLLQAITAWMGAS